MAGAIEDEMGAELAVPVPLADARAILAAAMPAAVGGGVAETDQVAVAEACQPWTSGAGWSD